MDLSAFDEYARTHNGLLTRRTVTSAECSARSWYRAIERGQLEALHPGVARFHGSERSVTQTIHAAVLAAGSGAMASHRSAAFLWGIPRPPDEPIDIILPKRAREAKVRGAFVHRPRDVRDLIPSRRSHVPVTNILRTLCDLGALDAAAVPAAVGHVVSTGLASPAALEVAIRRHGRRGRPGVPALRDSLGDWVLDGKPVDSVLETAMHRLLAAHGLPAAEFHPVIAGHEVDFRIIGSPIVLECDGWTTHGLVKAQFEQDRVRDADLSALGHVVLRFTYRAIVTRPRKEAERIRRNVERWAPHLLAA